MTREEFLRWASCFPDALLLAAVDGEILAANAALTELVGRREQHLVGQDLRQWVREEPADAQRSLRLWAGSGRMLFGPARWSLEGIGPLRCEGALVRGALSGGRESVVVRVRPKDAAAERFLELNRRLEELNREIRMRKASEAAVRKQKEWLQVTLSSIGDAVIATDVETRIEFINSVGEELTGWPLAEALGRPVNDVFTIFDATTGAPMACPLQRALRERCVVGLANHAFLRSRTGAQRPIADSAAPILEPDGTMVGAVVVFHDVSKQYEARAALERARDEALAASRAKDDFLAALSHELRTPLNPALLLASEAATNPSLPEAVREDFSAIEKHILLEARLIDDLLDVTRIVRGKLSVDLESLDLAGAITESLEAIRPDLQQKTLEISVELAAPNHRVMGDPSRLQQVFRNVLNNAVKFTAAGGRIRVTSRAEGSREVAVDFTDTGVGMTPDEVQRLFTPFFQGEPEGRPAAHRFGGLGLGLAIAKSIVKLHQGRIEARSGGRAQGTTVTVVLPLASEKEDADAPTAAAPTPIAPHDGAARRLLLVEDHQPTRDTIARLLEARNYVVVTAGSMSEAVALAARMRFDLVISDIGLPDGDGHVLMRHLHDRHRLHGIALSGYGMDNDVARSAEVGFVAHLTKPAGIGTLERCLSEFWRGAAGT